MRARGVVATSGSSHSSPIRGQSGRSSPTSANRSNRRQSRPLADRPPTGASSSSPTTTAMSFKRRPMSCPRSISTASDPCRTPGHRSQQSRQAAGLGETPRRRRKNVTSEGKAGVPGAGFRARETGARGSRVSQHSAHACGSAIGRAILAALSIYAPATRRSQSSRTNTCCG